MLRPGDKAWIALGAGVLVYELAALPEELMSEAADRYMLTHPWLVRSAAFIVAAHVANFVPAQCDPLAWLFRAKFLLRRTAS